MSEYGFSEYGIGSYGVDPSPAYLTTPISVISVDGYNITIEFSVDMRDTGMFDVANYSLVAVSNASPVTFGPYTTISVLEYGSLGISKINVQHQGTTLGGTYTVSVFNLLDVYGLPIETDGNNTATIMTYGEPPNYIMFPLSGTSLLMLFFEPLIPYVISGSDPIVDIMNLDNYSITTRSFYPIQMSIDGVSYYETGAGIEAIILDVSRMTATLYDSYFMDSGAIRYDGTYLPSSSTEFTGVEYGIGISTPTSSYLKINKWPGSEYGWTFLDDTGKLSATSSYRIDISFDMSTAVFIPSIDNSIFGYFTIGTGLASPGIMFIMGRFAGIDILVMIADSFSRVIQIGTFWDLSSKTVTVIKNVAANSCVVLLDDVLLATEDLSSLVGGVPIEAGVTIAFDSTFNVYNFKLLGVNVEATSTVYSLSWNFLHSVYSGFVGSSILSRKKILTENGPLVKYWGDDTPATKNDVEVRVNGFVVDVVDVNPYLGEIELDVPIPLMAPGTIRVHIDYAWMPSVTMEMGGLNTDGSVLNKWDNASGRVYPTISDTLGAMDTESRFNMRLVLGPIERIEPIARSPRFFGFEKDYSSVLNDPTTLLLNQDPSSVSVNKYEYNPSKETAKFEGLSRPELSETPWILNGTDTGYVNDGLGTYTLIDNNNGRYPELASAFYYREINLSDPSYVHLATRFIVSSYTLDGVYAGICIGIHDNNKMYLLGLLEVNGIKHVGILKDSLEPELVTSWNIGPKSTVEIVSINKCQMPTTDVPVFLKVGDRFQVLYGTQAGLYTITNMAAVSGGMTEITIDTVFPYDFTTYGNNIIETVFEVDWSGSTTYRMVIDTSLNSMVSYVSGEILAEVYSSSSPEIPVPSQTFLLSTTGKGQVFWGSMGGSQITTSVWSFFRYGISPVKGSLYSKRVIVSTDMSVLPPEDDINSGWFTISPTGTSSVLSGSLLLKNTYGESSSFGYERIEPFLSEQFYADVDFSFKVESECSAFGDAGVTINDTDREVKFGTLMYVEGSTPYRKVVWTPSVSLSGKSENDWTPSTSNGVVFHREDSYWYLYKGMSLPGGFFYKDMDVSEIPYVDDGGRTMECRFMVDFYTGSANKTGIAFLFESGVVPNSRILGISLSTSPMSVSLVSSDALTVISYPFDWDDNSFHTYKVMVDVVADTATLLIDEVVQIPPATYSLFDLSSDSVGVFIGSFNGPYYSYLKLDYLWCKATPPTNVKRTLAIWNGGDYSGINSYYLPRTDDQSIPNDSSLAVINPFDYTTFSSIRIHKDPTWGVTVFDTTIAPPPYYKIYDPTTALISVEYQNLPIKESTFGSVIWGSLGASDELLNMHSISQSRWERIGYSVFLYNDGEESILNPQNHTLNRQNVVHSGELVIDKTPEVISIYARSLYEIWMNDCGITAKNILIVSKEGVLLPRDEWSFDVEKQIITVIPIEDKEETGDIKWTDDWDTIPVDIVFIPGLPVTETYLLDQPLWEGALILNEDTPIEQLTQTDSYSWQVVHGVVITDINSDFIDNTRFDYIEDVVKDSKYTDLSIIEIEDDGEYGLISSICDSTFNGHGLLDIGLDGGVFMDSFEVISGPVLPPVGIPVISPVLSPIYSVLTFGGGTSLGGVIGPGYSTLNPSYGGGGSILDNIIDFTIV